MEVRDPPHYLKALKTTTTPKRLLWLSTAWTTRKRRGRSERAFHVAVLGSTHWTARKGVRRDSLHAYDDAGALWSEVASRCPVGRRVTLFSYDLAEQMRLSQMLTHLPALGWTLDKIVLERTASWCLLRNGKRSLMCCDLRSWCPVAFAAIAADVNWTEPIVNDLKAGSGFAVERCDYRVRVIRDATLQILNWIEGEGHGPFKPTGSGQSYSAYRRRFMAHKLLVHDDTERLDAERRAMATGRAEAWLHGHVTNGPYVEYDLHAAYCTIGRDCDVPTAGRARIDRPSSARLERAMDRYAILADVTVTTKAECVPCTIGGRTLWPVGTFRTLLWDPELRLAIAHADKVEVHRAWTYHRAPALRTFCAYVLENMETQTQVYGLLVQRVLKHWSRTLVGRLGLRYRAWHKFGAQNPPDVRLVTYLDIDDGLRTEMLLAGSQRLLLGDMAESPESLPQIPGWVMSECRARLWAAMMVAGLDNVAYVDTDSMILAPRGMSAAQRLSAAPVEQGWVRKGSYSSLTIYGPRNLTVGPDRRVSGLPLTATQNAPLEYTGEVMRSVKQSMRSGELNTVVTLPREFHLKPHDLRREHNQDGTTSPYYLEAPNV